MSDLEQLANIINTIFSKDNQARKESEALLSQLQTKDFNAYILLFGNLLNASPRKDIRTFCLLHMRRLLSDFTDDITESQWINLNGEVQKFVKDLLVDLLQREPESAPRKVLCDFVGELVATIKTMDTQSKEICAPEGRDWDSITQVIWGLLESGNNVLIGSGLKILGILFKHCYKDFSQDKEKFAIIMKQGLEHQDLKIKVDAIEALTEYLTNVDRKECKPLGVLIPLILSNIAIIIDKNEDLGVDAMACLSEIVEFEANILKDHFAETLNTLRLIAENDHLTIHTLRENALEIIVTLIEKFPKLSGKQEGLVNAIFQAIFTYMVTCVLDPDNQWACPPEGFLQTKEEGSSIEPSVKYCMDLFNRLIAKLGQKKTIPVLTSIVEKMVSTKKWRYKYCAVMSLSQIGEYVDQTEELDPVVDFTLKFLEDDGPKVRYAALHCLGQLSDDRRFDFQERYNAVVLPAFIRSFNDQVPRVVGHGLAALTNFLEGSSQKGISKHLQTILEPCLKFLDQGISVVKENAVSAIAALAVATRQDFIPYWQKTAEIIFHILNNCNKPEYKQLRGQTIECLTLIGESIGKQEFSKAADEIIKVMINIQVNQMEETDPQKIYLLAGWQRLSLLFKQDFAPYLKEILPSLFGIIEKTIQNYERKVNAAREEDDDVENALGEGQSGLEKPNTSESEEVSISIKMIATFLTESNQEFLPYVEKTNEIFVYLLSKSRNDNLRLSVAKALSGIIKVINASSLPDKQQIVSNISNKYIDLLWKVYADEIDIGNLMTYLSSIKAIMKESGPIMEEKQLAALTNQIVEVLKESYERKISNTEQITEDGGEIDEDQLNSLIEENEKEDELQCAIADLIDGIFATYKEMSLPLAHIVSKDILPLCMNDNATPKVHKFAVLLINGMLNHLGFSLLPNDVPVLCQLLIKFVCKPHPEVRDTAAIGIGIVIERSKEEFKNLIDPCVKGLLTALSIKPRKDEDQRAYWRARVHLVLDLGKVIKYQSQAIETKDLIQIWFRNLPATYFVDEARWQHDMLLDIIDHDPTLILGPQGQNLGIAIELFARVVNTRLISLTFIERIKKLIEGWEANQQIKPLLHEAVAKLEKDLQEKLQKALA